MTTSIPRSLLAAASIRTDLGALVIGDCLDVLRELLDGSLDLVITSPPYDGQPKYDNGERYEKEWYEGFF